MALKYLINYKAMEQILTKPDTYGIRLKI